MVKQMQQFKKWWGSFDCDTIDCGGIGCDDVCKEIREETWKVALECIRDKMLPNCHEPMDIYDFIEEELNES